ncbi:MAG TPA: hypothetical protein VMA95_11960 [Streptosporangiaceae bacterium]|nr:hypothetical protein [Streptosporangiaceae bacterium]
MGGYGWHLARREIAVAAGLVLAISVAAWVLFGAEVAGTVALACLALGLLGQRVLLPPREPEESRPDTFPDTPTTTFTGFWRTQTDLADATASMSAWDLTTRRRISNLLAARLAERHGISLTQDPEAARAVFLGDLAQRRAGEDLWFWIDPERQTPADAMNRQGIPARVLVALIQRLEQL